MATGRVQGKVAIVTGAAQGLGLGAAELLAREGATVVLTDLQDDAGEAAAHAIADAGAAATYLHLDVTDEASWQGVIDTVVAEHGALHVLFNNAGIALQKDVLATSVEEWDQTQAVNLRGVFLGTKLAGAPMTAAGGGSIVNMSSSAGIRAHPELAAYSASKGGVRLLTKAAAVSYGRSGSNVRVNSIHPAFVETPLMQPFLDANGITREQLEAAHPLGVLGQPIDIAYGVLYLASDEARWVTGTELVIDGGMLAA
jgi:3(or 17)beta-hydroxysteroid dehydrogenase